MQDNTADLLEDLDNPLDCVEDILINNDWICDRKNEEEISVHINGKMGTYHLHFLWQPEYNALELVCELCDISIVSKTIDATAKAIVAINASMWLGHFDIQEDIFIPQYRYTSLLHGLNLASGLELIEQLIHVALSECERFYPAFLILSKPQNEDGLMPKNDNNDTVDQSLSINSSNEETLSLALMDTAGES